MARRHEAESVIYEMELERKACVRMYNENHIRYIFFALASSKPDAYSPPGMPIGMQPPPEDYETLRELLQTEVGANSSFDVKQCNVQPFFSPFVFSFVCSLLTFSSVGP